MARLTMQKTEIGYHALVQHQPSPTDEKQTREFRVVHTETPEDRPVSVIDEVTNDVIPVARIKDARDLLRLVAGHGGRRGTPSDISTPMAFDSIEDAYPLMEQEVEVAEIPGRRAERDLSDTELNLLDMTESSDELIRGQGRRTIRNIQRTSYNRVAGTAHLNGQDVVVVYDDAESRWEIVVAD